MGKFNDAREKQQNEHGSTYLGETPLSHMIRDKVAVVANMYNGLLQPSSIEGDDRWGPMWQHVPSEHTASARMLIVSCVLVGACSWDKRFVDPVTHLPLILFRILEEDVG